MAIPRLELLVRDAFDDARHVSFGSGRGGKDDGGDDGFRGHDSVHAFASHADARQADTVRADRVLVEKIQSGDEDAYDTLFLTYFPRLVDFAMTLAVPRAVAEELVADVFLSI